MLDRATVIDWYGPIPLRKVWRVAAENGWSEGIVVAVGLHRPLFYAVRQKPIQCVAITQLRDGRPDETTRRKLRRLSRLATRVWVGVPKGCEADDDMDTDRAPDPHDLQIAEQALAVFLKARLNRDVRERGLAQSCMVLNRWFDYRDGSPRARPHSRWPDIIDYDHTRAGARLVWVDRASGHLTLRHYEREVETGPRSYLRRFVRKAAEDPAAAVDAVARM